VSRIWIFKRIFEPYVFHFHDFLFETCFCDTYSDQLEMNLNKPREVFIYNNIIYKKNSHIVHRLLWFENYKWRFEAYFSEFRLLKSRKSVKTCHLMFVVVSNLIHQGASVITEISSANGYRNLVASNNYEVTHGPKLSQNHFQKV
jgi:hypothetical protein